MTGHILVPRVGLDLSKPGAYLIHAEANGNPHCVAALVRPGEDCCPRSSQPTFARSACCVTSETVSHPTAVPEGAGEQPEGGLIT